MVVRVGREKLQSIECREMLMCVDLTATLVVVGDSWQEGRQVQARLDRSVPPANQKKRQPAPRMRKSREA